MKMLQQTVAQNGYTVDSAAVAEAIVRRLLAGGALPAPADRR